MAIGAFAIESLNVHAGHQPLGGALRPVLGRVVAGMWSRLLNIVTHCVHINVGIFDLQSQAPTDRATTDVDKGGNPPDVATGEQSLISRR